MLRIAGSLGYTQKKLQVPLPTLKPVKENLQGRYIKFEATSEGLQAGSADTFYKVTIEVYRV